MEILPSLLQQARDDGLKLEIRIDARANTVVIKDSRGGQAWVAAERYLDAIGAQRQGTEESMANKLWHGLCNSRGAVTEGIIGKVKPSTVPITIDAPYGLAHDWDPRQGKVVVDASVYLTLKQLVAATILRGREELER